MIIILSTTTTFLLIHKNKHNFSNDKKEKIFIYPPFFMHHIFATYFLFCFVEEQPINIPFLKTFKKYVFLFSEKKRIV